MGWAKDRTEDIDRINKLNMLPIKKNNRHNDLVYFILNKEFGL